MAVLKGKGSMTGINLVARVYDNGVTKDGKSQYVDLQVDSRDSHGPDQTNLHLVSERKEIDGEVRFNNSAPYSMGQLEEIVKAAGPNVEPVVNKDGEKVGQLYGVKGNVMPASRGTGLVVNTKTLEQSEFKVDAETMKNQFASMKEAKVAKEAKEAKVAAKGNEQTAQTEQVAEVEQQVDEPAVG